MAGLSRRNLIAGLGAGAALALPTSTLATGARVRAPAGHFEGNAEAGVLSFKGIRYGRAERFRAPVPLAPTDKMVAARAFGPVCPQSGDRYGPQSED